MADYMVIRCPFCKKRHAMTPWRNVLCSCGAKFYVNTDEWWDRKTGKIVKVNNWD